MEGGVQSPGPSPGRADERTVTPFLEPPAEAARGGGRPGLSAPAEANEGKDGSPPSPSR